MYKINNVFVKKNYIAETVEDSHCRKNLRCL